MVPLLIPSEKGQYDILCVTPLHECQCKGIEL